MRLAVISAQLTGQRYVVYRDGRGLFHICAYDEWRDDRGEHGDGHKPVGR